MVNVLDFSLGVVLVVSLTTIIVYAVIFLCLTAWTGLRAPRRDPLAEELDDFLAELWALEGDDLALATRSSQKSR